MALSPAERIRLIQSAGRTLAELDRTDVELAFEMFGIEESSGRPVYWHNDPYAYVVERLKPVPDETLINLNAHLSDDTQPPVAVGTWQKDHHRVFLSHTSDHRKLAGEIRQKLLPEGIDVFVAHDRIETNQEWIEEIRVSLATCDVLVALFSNDFLTSKWCDQELGTALGRGINVISVKYGADPHGFVSPKQGFEVNPDDPHAAARIAAEVCRLVKGERPSSIPDPAAVVVKRYARSHSFDEARTNLQQVMKLTASDWTPEMVEMAETAGRENGQLSQAYWYEELVPDVLIEHLNDIGVRRGGRSTTAQAGSTPAREPDIPF